MIFILCACDKDSIGPQQVNTSGEHGQEGRKVWVLNEGNFNWGNASLDTYYPTGESLIKGAYTQANDQPLGDVAYNIASYKGFKLIIVNNSGKMLMIDTADQKLVRQTTGLNSPRRVAVWHDVAFVTELYSKEVYLVNLATGEVMTSVPVGGHTEYIVSGENRIYVAEVEAGNVLVMNPQTATITDTLHAGAGIRGMAMDGDGNLWIASARNGSPELIKLDITNGDELDSLELPPGKTPGHLTTNGDGSRICFTAGGVYCFSTNAPTLTDAPLIPQNDRIIYALAIDPKTGEIYLSDPVDYTQRSHIYRYSSHGYVIDEFKAGIICGNFGF